MSPAVLPARVSPHSTSPTSHIPSVSYTFLFTLSRPLPIPFLPSPSISSPPLRSRPHIAAKGSGGALKINQRVRERGEEGGREVERVGGNAGREGEKKGGDGRGREEWEERGRTRTLSHVSLYTGLQLCTRFEVKRSEVKVTQPTD